MEMDTTVTPTRKLSVSACPNSAALMSPVTSVATVLEYFFRIVSAYLKKNEDRTPCSALFATSSMVTCARPPVSRYGACPPDSHVCGCLVKAAPSHAPPPCTTSPEQIIWHVNPQALRAAERRSRLRLLLCAF